MVELADAEKTALCDALMAMSWYPDHLVWGAEPLLADDITLAALRVPRYPAIDPDIVVAVHDMAPKTLGSRVAMENTLQRRRDGRSG